MFDVDPDTGRLINPRQLFSRPAVRSIAMLDGEKSVELSAQWMIGFDKTSKTIRSYSVKAKTGKLQLSHQLKMDMTVDDISVHSSAGLIFAINKQSKRIDVFRINDGGETAPYSLKGFQLEYQVGARR